MTTLQDTAVGPASQNELISPARLLLLAPTEPRAPIAILSPAKRTALIACFKGGGLKKKDGAGQGPQGGKRVPGMTTADLARDGMLTVTTKSSIWFSTTDGARELVCADVALSGNH